jgi:hypothetical protein
VQEVDISERVDTVSEDKSEVPENVENSVTEEEKQEVAAETSEVKDIITEDERELWEKHKKRREWKEPNSGIVHHEYIEEERRQNND